MGLTGGKNMTQDERFDLKVIHGPGQCWTWSGSRTMGGLYGSTTDPRRPGKSMGAHRRAWERVNGQIPEGMWIDHLCRMPLCVNPDHLECVTPGENTRRGLGPTLARARYAAWSHCPHGHEYTPENTYWYPRKKNRKCRECCRLQARAAYARKKEAA